MGTYRVLWLLLIGVMITGAAYAAPGWLATGTVTKVQDGTLYFLSRSNNVYHIDISAASVFLGSGKASGKVKVGDTVRIYGQLSKPRFVCASRVRILSGGIAAAGRGPEKEVHVIVTPEPPPPPPAPSATAPCPAPAPPCVTPCVEAKGIVTDIDWKGHTVTLQTSDMSYTVNVDNAVMVRGTQPVLFGSLNVGDTLWVSGRMVAQNVLDGQQIRVLRGSAQAQGALPLNPINVVGVISQVDYSSRTFKMQGPTANIVVSCDDNTDIYFRDIRKQFNDLRPGTKVNMAGNGSLASGYAANYIQIVGGP